MRNVTIKIDDEVARWAKVHAARHDTSISRMVEEALRRKMLEEEGYDAARRDWTSRGPVAMGRGGGYPDRDELHDR